MMPSIKLTAADNKTDIQAYTSMWHQRIEHKFGHLDQNQFHVANIVTTGAQGEILFPECYREMAYFRDAELLLPLILLIFFASKSAPVLLLG